MPDYNSDDKKCDTVSDFIRWAVAVAPAMKKAKVKNCKFTEIHGTSHFISICQCIYNTGITLLFCVITCAASVWIAYYITFSCSVIYDWHGHQWDLTFTQSSHKKYIKTPVTAWLKASAHYIKWCSSVSLSNIYIHRYGFSLSCQWKSLLHLLILWRGGKKE